MPFDIAPLLRPGKAALLLSEVQRGIIGDLAKGSPLASGAEETGVIGNSARLAAAAREHGAPVVHCLADTSPDRYGAGTNCRLYTGGAGPSAGRSAHNPDGDTPCPEVWQDGDILSVRTHGLHPMADNQLDRRLRNKGIDTVIVVGVSLNVALLGLCIEAVNSNYTVIVPRDAVSGFPSDYAQPVIRNTLSFITTLTTVDDIIASWPKG
ncbi:MAG: isochorismatase family protein [Novosphingobium sp.]|nr:isochorismatase family protein [Novosphingobium sp.]